MCIRDRLCTSCMDNFLDTESPSIPSDENLFKSTALTEAALMGVYGCGKFFAWSRAGNRGISGELPEAFLVRGDRLVRPSADHAGGVDDPGSRMKRRRIWGENCA